MINRQPASITDLDVGDIDHWKLLLLPIGNDFMSCLACITLILLLLALICFKSVMK